MVRLLPFSSFGGVVVGCVGWVGGRVVPNVVSVDKPFFFKLVSSIPLSSTYTNLESHYDATPKQPSAADISSR